MIRGGHVGRPGMPMPTINSMDSYRDEYDHAAAMEEEKRRSKLDESEMISLLRTLYLKSGSQQNKANQEDLRDDREYGDERSQSRSKSSLTKNSKKYRRGFFGMRKNKRVGDLNSQTASKSSKRGGLFGKKIKVPKEQTPNFEYLNEHDPYGHPMGPPSMGPYGGMPTDPYGYPPNMTEEEYHARMQQQHGHLHGYPPSPPSVHSGNNMNMNMSAGSGYGMPHHQQFRQGPPQGMHPGSPHPNGMMNGAMSPPPPESHHFGPNSYPNPYHTNNHGMPQCVRGENLTVNTTVEHVEAVVPQSNNGNKPGTPQSANNTVTGTPVGPPRINSIRGTALSPIVEAEDSQNGTEQINNTTANNGASSPPLTYENNVHEQAALKRQPSPPGVVNTMNRPLQQKDKMPASPRSPPISPQSKTAEDQWSLPLFPVASPTDTESPPRDVIVDPRQMAPRQSSSRSFPRGPGHNLLDKDTVSDISSTDGKDPWNRSPNSVLSQVAKDMEPNPQCLIRGSRLYDALHYTFMRICCDGRGNGSSRGKEKRERDYRGHGTDRDSKYMTIEPDYSSKKYAGPSYNKYYHYDDERNPRHQHFSRHV